MKGGTSSKITSQSEQERQEHGKHWVSILRPGTSQVQRFEREWSSWEGQHGSGTLRRNIAGFGSGSFAFHEEITRANSFNTAHRHKPHDPISETFLRRSGFSKTGGTRDILSNRTSPVVDFAQRALWTRTAGACCRPQESADDSSSVSPSATAKRIGAMLRNAGG